MKDATSEVVVVVVIKGLFIIYWGYGTGVSGYGTRTFFNASEYGTQRFLCFYGTGHELFLGKKSFKLYFIDILNCRVC